MIKKSYTILCLICIVFVHLSAQEKLSPIELSVDSILHKYVPDRRVDVFDIKVKGDSIMGCTSNKEAWQKLKTLSPHTRIHLLPEAELGEKIYGVINLSVADIREEAKFTSGMATQATLGTPIRILEKKEWYRIQTPDGYIAWSQLANFHPMTKKEFNAWTTAPKIIFTDYFGFAYSQPDKNSQTVSDLVATNILRKEGEKGDFYKVSYPDGKIAYVLKSQSESYDKWYSSRKLTGESLVKKSFTLMGIPYVWGGTSVKGMDCSGFTKIVFFMHGVILTRDASQQVHTGIPVDISKGYGNLQIGDLLFFGKKDEKTQKERIRHVGFYIGNNEFIHASGSIRISSMDKGKENYDELNTTEFIRATRIVGAVDTKGIWAIDNNPFYRTITEQLQNN